MGKRKAVFSFNYTDAVRGVCEDMCAKVPEFHTIDMQRVAVSFTLTRNDSKFGVYASLTPLRFEGGQRTQVQRGRTWEVQRVLRQSKTSNDVARIPDEESDYLYILYVCVPRFMNLPLTSKLETITHELLHIGPKFDGDIRRFEGRCFAHGSSRKKYDAMVRRLLKIWLDKDPPPEIWNFLQWNYDELTERFGSIGGLKIPPPKIIGVK